MYIFSQHTEIQEELQKQSIEELENRAVKEYAGRCTEDSILGDILSVRKEKLNKTFSWSKENIARLQVLDEAIISVFAKAKTEVRQTCKQFKERLNKDDDFLNGYEFTIKVLPYVELPNKHLSDVVHNEFCYEIDCIVLQHYNLNMYLEKKYALLAYIDSSNDDIPELNGQKFGMGMRELCLYSKLSLPDVLKINKLVAIVIAEHQHFVGQV
jgi:hypothetical protein